MKSIVHFVRVVLGIDSPSTQVTSPEQQLLRSYAANANIVVELGCFEGNTSAALATSTSGTVYAVDHFTPGRFGICYSEWIAKIHCRRKGLKNLLFLKGDTSSAARDFTSPVDFLFIDADHSYEGVKRDWDAWFPKVQRSDGIVALHDCRLSDSSPNRLGSMEFYEKDLRNNSEVVEIDSIDSLAVFRVQPS